MRSKKNAHTPKFDVGGEAETKVQVEVALGEKVASRWSTIDRNGLEAIEKCLFGNKLNLACICDMFVNFIYLSSSTYSLFDDSRSPLQYIRRIKVIENLAHNANFFPRLAIFVFLIKV